MVAVLVQCMLCAYVNSVLCWGKEWEGVKGEGLGGEGRIEIAGHLSGAESVEQWAECVERWVYLVLQYQ